MSLPDASMAAAGRSVAERERLIAAMNQYPDALATPPSKLCVRAGVLEEVRAIGTVLPYGIDCGWPV